MSRKMLSKPIGRDKQPKQIPSFEGVARHHEFRLRALGMCFVGSIGVVLAIGGIVFSFINPTQPERLWGVISSILMVIIGLLIYWANPRRAKP